MAIDKALVTDAEELVSLINSAYRGESSKIGWTSESHLLDGNRIDIETMSGYLTDPAVTLLKYADDNKTIKGCVYLHVKRDHLYLGMLTVSPWAQAAGIGRQLLDAATEHCLEKNCKYIEITVISSRYELIEWYKRRGFYDTGEKRAFPMTPKFGIAKQPFDLTVMNKYIT